MTVLLHMQDPESGVSLVVVISSGIAGGTAVFVVIGECNIHSGLNYILRR